MSVRVDYDAIAHLYDDRRRDYQADTRLEAFIAERHVGRSDPVRILDVGCGTGKQLAADRTRFGRATLVGVDRSAGMLAVARARDASVIWIRGDAGALPLQSASFDYATNQFSYPHIADKNAFAAEIFRVLRPGGRFVITNIDPWAMDHWILYRYFPDARALDERDFLPQIELERLLAGAGFTRVAATSADLSKDEALESFFASVSRRHTASQLMAISDTAYEAGLRRVRDAVAAAGGGTVVRSAFVLLTIVADKPE